MKSLILASVFLATSNLFAADYVPVPEGSYSGVGTWTDNLGGQGTLSMSVRIYLDSAGLHNDYSADFSDGRQYSGAAVVVFSQNSEYTYVANINGAQVTVGQGVSTPDSYQTASLMLNANETFSEMGSFSCGKGWHRMGSITNSKDGRVTLIDITERKT